MIREFGRAYRLPFSPADSKTAAMLSAWPITTVYTGGLLGFIRVCEVQVLEFVLEFRALERSVEYEVWASSLVRPTATSKN